jgi:hypothetical protein
MACATGAIFCRVYYAQTIHLCIRYYLLLRNVVCFLNFVINVVYLGV